MEKIILQQACVYRYNIYDSIDNFSDYLDLINGLRETTDRDHVVLYINSPGGRVDVGLSIISAIKSCPACVTAIVEGPSYSMASVIALACDDLQMFDNTFLMFHNYSTASFGKGAELMGSLNHNDKHIKKLMMSVCHPFLSKKEIEKINNDQDIYIYDDDEELGKRKLRHYKV